MFLSSLVCSAVVTGGVAALFAGIAAAVCGRAERGSAQAPIAAISHIVVGGPPPPEPGPAGRNTAFGIGLHTGASVFWATFALGLAVGARLTGLERHRAENDGERRDAERGAGAMALQETPQRRISARDRGAAAPPPPQAVHTA